MGKGNGSAHSAAVTIHYLPFTIHCFRGLHSFTHHRLAPFTLHASRIAMSFNLAACGGARQRPHRMAANEQLAEKRPAKITGASRNEDLSQNLTHGQATPTSGHHGVWGGTEEVSDSFSVMPAMARNGGDQGPQAMLLI